MTKPKRALTLTTIGLLAALAALPAGAGAQASRPFSNDPLGPVRNVTAHWQRFQPATDFCIRPNVVQYTPGGTGATATGADPVCRRSGFAPTAKNLVRSHVEAPLLCRGCIRLFIDFSRIPAQSAPGDGKAHGHAYYHLDSINSTYTVDPVAHSPNTKNFTNDKAVSPAGSLQEKLIGAFDLHAIAYVTDTASYVHTKVQGPYYIGPTYLTRSGRHVDGVYLDVDVADAAQWPNPQMNAIGYMAGYNSGGICPADDDMFYGGCIDWGGMSSSTIDPFND